MTDSSIPDWARVVAVFDTETTGIAPETTRIVTANISVITEAGNVEDRHDWLIDCGIDIPPQATAVHGITTEHMKEHGMDAAQGIYEMLTVLQSHFTAGIPVVAYNAAYDFTILNREAKRYGHNPLNTPRPIIDPMIIDRQVDRYRKGKRTLEAATAVYGVSLDGAHTASADAIAAGHVARALATKYSEQLNVSAGELHDLQIQWAAEQAESYAQWRRSQGMTVFSGDGVWPVR